MTEKNNETETDTKKNDDNKKENTKNDECKCCNEKECDHTDKIEELEKQLNEEKNKNIRLVAEFDNYRKRLRAHEQETLESGEKKIIKELLIVLDSFDKALNTDKDKIKYEDLSAIFLQLTNVLKKFGLEKINTKIGDNFNVDVHEAISISNEKNKDLNDKIANIVVDGYMFKSDIIRHTQVIIGKYKEDSNTK